LNSNHPQLTFVRSFTTSIYDFEQIQFWGFPSASLPFDNQRIAHRHHHADEIPLRSIALWSLRIPPWRPSHHGLERVVARAQALWWLPSTETLSWYPRHKSTTQSGSSERAVQQPHHHLQHLPQPGRSPDKPFKKRGGRCYDDRFHSTQPLDRWMIGSQIGLDGLDLAWAGAGFEIE
jgi:hypothetical protein